MLQLSIVISEWTPGGFPMDFRTCEVIGKLRHNVASVELVFNCTSRKTSCRSVPSSAQVVKNTYRYRILVMKCCCTIWLIFRACVTGTDLNALTKFSVGLWLKISCLKKGRKIFDRRICSNTLLNNLSVGRSINCTSFPIIEQGSVTTSRFRNFPNRNFPNRDFPTLCYCSFCRSGTKLNVVQFNSIESLLLSPIPIPIPNPIPIPIPIVVAVTWCFYHVCRSSTSLNCWLDKNIG